MEDITKIKLKIAFLSIFHKELICDIEYTMGRLNAPILMYPRVDE